MAALAADQVTMVYTIGQCGKMALYSLKNVTAADTADLASQFKVVKRAGIVSDTGTTIASCAITSSTVITIPAGPAADGVWMLVVGVSS